MMPALALSGAVAPSGVALCAAKGATLFLTISTNLVSQTSEPVLTRHRLMLPPFYSGQQFYSRGPFKSNRKQNETSSRAVPAGGLGNSWKSAGKGYQKGTTSMPLV
jgi:hypothetical protein